MSLASVSRSSDWESAIPSKRATKWNENGNARSTYLNPEAKRRIAFFLSSRLHGRNLDLCGGWQPLYPNSVAVDLSSVSLKNNPLKEKVHFDLEQLSSGKRLPFPSHSFDSATMISGWQYVKGRDALIREVKRLLKPNAEWYIINAQGAGMDGCVVGEQHTSEIAALFKGKGYDTLVENIPHCSDVDTHQSACVAMPDSDGISTITHRETRVRANRAIVSNPRLFTKKYTDWEMAAYKALLDNMDTFPITRYSQEYLDRVEAFGAEIHEKTGVRVVMFLEFSIPHALLMLTKTGRVYPDMVCFGDSDIINSHELQGLLIATSRKHHVSYTHSLGYFDEMDSPETLLSVLTELKRGRTWETLDGSRYALKLEEGDLERYARFIAAVPLNELTRTLQAQLYQALKERENFEEILLRSRAWSLSGSLEDFKGERSMEDLVATAQRLRKRPEEVLGWARTDFSALMPLLRSRLMEHHDIPQEAHVMCGD